MSLLIKLRRQEGKGSLGWLRFWRQRGAHILALRDGDGDVCGMIGLLELEHLARPDAADDPGVAPLLGYLEREPPPPGGRLLYYRFWMGRDTHQEPSPELTRVLVHAVQRAFVTPRLAYVFSANHDPARWRPLHVQPGAGCAAVFAVDGREVGIFCQDARGRVPLSWFQEQLRSLAPPAATPPAPLSPDAVLAATRRALRVIDRPDLLRDNPLVTTALVPRPAGDDTAVRQARAELLSDLIRRECELVLQSPRDRDTFRVMHRTFFAAPAKQRVIAAELGLSFITYRRHLSAGIRRLADRLSQRLPRAHHHAPDAAAVVVRDVERAVGPLRQPHGPVGRVLR